MADTGCDDERGVTNLIWGCFEPHQKAAVLGHLQRQAGLKGRVSWQGGFLGSARAAFRRASKDRKQFVLAEVRRFVSHGVKRLFVVDHDRCARDPNGQLTLNFSKTEISSACEILHEAFPAIEILGYVVSFREDASDVSFRMRRVVRFEATGGGEGDAEAEEVAEDAA